MGSHQNGLPRRFPIGTRYVIEGRGGSEGCLRISMRYLEFPDGRHVDLPIDQAFAARSRGRSRRRAAARK